MNTHISFPVSSAQFGTQVAQRLMQRTGFVCGFENTEEVGQIVLRLYLQSCHPNVIHDARLKASKIMAELRDG